MHAAKLGAVVQLRKHLARIEQVLVIECTFDPLLLFEVGFIEHHRHEITFFNTNPVFTGQNSTHFDTKPQNIGAKFLSFVQFSWNIGVV